MTTTTSDPATWTRGAGPLTTVFTTPDFCQSLYWTNTVVPPLSSLICMPPRFKQLYDYSWGFYSPGICPTGYTQGCDFPTSLATTASNTGWVSYGGPVVASETLRICCPTGYACVTESNSQPYSQCSATTDAAERAFAIQVRWAASDLSILATDPTVPGKTFEASATTGTTTGTTSAKAVSTGARATTTTTTTTNSTSAADADTAGGSQAMAIGIGVGVGAAVLLAAAVALFLWFRRRKQSAANGARLHSRTDLHEPAPGGGIGGGGGGGGGGVDGGSSSDGRVMELDSKALGGGSSELDSSPAAVVAEMPAAPTFYAELPGDMPTVWHEKPTDGDDYSGRGGSSSHRTGAQQEEPGPLGGLRRRSTGRGTAAAAAAAAANLEVSPLVTSPSSWRSSVTGSVSDLTDRDPNGNTM